MQTPAEKYLVEQLIRFIKREKGDSIVPLHILNIGAGRSLSIENQLTNAGCKYTCDRVDIADCTVVHPSVDKCWRCSVESMSPVMSNKYSAAFANYVLEHILNVNKASREIYRVLKTCGILIASIPNPAAPEFLLSKLTPLWFHKMIKGKEVWETYYAYNSIKELIKIFELAGFHTIEIRYYTFLEFYLAKLPLLGMFGKMYAKIISSLKIKSLMGNVCAIFEKT